MELHRIRFINRVPRAIQCLSFADDGSRLALSRDDGSLEVWTTSNGVCVKDLWIPGRASTSIEALQWCGRRLFTGCLSGLLEEWDLKRLQPNQSINVCGGPIWCLHASPDKSCVAVGCENGKVYLYDVITGNLNSLHHFEARILSIVWHPDGSYLFCGGTDGVIRKISVDSGCCSLEIILDHSKKSIIWDLEYIDPFIISADSCGRVTMWHNIFGTVVQSFTEHSADVLALAIDNNNAIYSSGVDKKISCFKKVASKNEWIKDSELNVHSNDVRTLAISSKGFLASGGVDTRLFLSDIKKFKNSHCNIYSQLQDSSRYFSVADKANIIMHQTNTSVQLWQFSLNDDLLLNMPVYILEIKTKGANYILSSAISSDATKVAMSTVKHFWLYHLNLSDLKLNCVLSLALPSYKQQFCCDNKLLVLACINEGLKVYNLHSNHWNNPNDNWDSYGITDFFCSNEGSCILVVNVLKEMYIYDLVQGSSLFKLPEMDSYPQNFFCLSSMEFIICCFKELYLYNLSTSQLTKLKEKMKGVKGFCMTGENVLSIYNDKSLLTSEPQRDYIQFKEIYSNDHSSILFVSPFCSKKFVVVENLISSTISTSSQVLFKDHYAT